MRPSHRAHNRSIASGPKRPAFTALALIAAALAGFAATAPAAAAQRVEVVDVPSLQGNVDLAQNELNATDALRATTLLPDGYDEQPERRWPVLYLLHGVGDNTGTWLDKGRAGQIAAGLPAIVVMPEGGRSGYTDHWIGGARKGSSWERYFLQEVVPAMEARYRILPGRSNHALAGLSMGGFGSLLFAAELPGYFGSAASFSGMLSLEDPVAQFLLPSVTHIRYQRLWGPIGGPYARAHSPVHLMASLRATNILLTTGNGLPDPRFTTGNAEGALTGGAVELGSAISARWAYAVGRRLGVPITLGARAGIHDWPYWQHDLARAIHMWGLFRPAPIDDAAARTSFTYQTIARTGNAWGLGYRFARPPRRELLFTRAGQQLSAKGGDGPITIEPGAADADASGQGTRPDCAFTATPPFTRTLPPGC
jgi:diacylglycerol O-acyltransferase/trehalose O-mycolyltransferase